MGNRFKKGNKDSVGYGRPPKLPNLEEAVARVLGEVVKAKGITALDQIMSRLRSMAARGNTKAAALILDRGYGKAKQHIEVDTVPRKAAADMFPAAPPEDIEK